MQSLAALSSGFSGASAAGNVYEDDSDTSDEDDVLDVFWDVVDDDQDFTGWTSNDIDQY